ncbi:hypothetical protein [Vibrio sagamiensis]|uniref:Uncharacterized protein n=1 Tax=Vibrio sagamiensis NBRC 104589 TaxID=1219064 RepID=A0A511QBQ8_9VIBR|nr:hypothetical protein [Vibrio sagamiensis]PNQ62118.1 hypothetical protein C1141_10855 [Vibrio agarivorans]GEM74730.1 hypothetical protein VSA01S_08420 [Vibrio sagamiensis NBRC 104589]
MKAKLFIFLMITLSLLSFNGMTDSATVYCATIDGNAWDWLYDDNGDYTNIEGKWEIQRINRLSSFRFFDISYNNYVKCQELCAKDGMVPHPARSNHSNWYIFRVHFENEEKIFAQGYYTLIRHADNSFIYRVQ